MKEIPTEQQRFAVRSIRFMMGRRKYSDGPQRIRNFIRINYRVEYTLGHCRRIWEQHSRATEDIRVQ